MDIVELRAALYRELVPADQQKPWRTLTVDERAPYVTLADAVVSIFPDTLRGGGRRQSYCQEQREYLKSQKLGA